MKLYKACEHTVVISLAVYTVIRTTSWSTPFYIASTVALLFGLLVVAARREFSIGRAVVGLPFYLLVGLFWLTTIWSIAPERTLQKCATLVPLAWLFYLSQSLLLDGHRAWLKRLTNLLPFVVFTAFIFILIATGSVRATNADDISRFGRFGNEAGAILTLCLPFAILGFIQSPNSRRISALTITIVTICVALSGSRGAMGMYALNIVLAFLMFRIEKRLSLRLAGSLLSVLIMTAVFVGVWGSGREMVVHTIGRFEGSLLLNPTTQVAVGSDERDWQRLLMILVAVDAVRRDPIKGIGYEAFPHYMDQETGEAHMSHNILITGWTEAGILGLLLVIWLALAGTHRLWVARKRSRAHGTDDFNFYSAALIAFIVMFVNAMFKPQFINPMFYVILAVALASRTVVERVVEPAQGELEHADLPVAEGSGQVC